jgi:hypothetical protein
MGTRQEIAEIVHKARESGVRIHLDSVNLRYIDLSDLELREAHLPHVDLRDANLRGTDLYSVSLRGADLGDARMEYANLNLADLRGADLQNTNLTSANLQGANLWGANLFGAVLTGIDAEGAILPTGKTLPEYIEALPAWLVSLAGRPLDEIVATWESHVWDSCPMDCALRLHGEGWDAVPEHLQIAVGEFIALFDGQHLPAPAVGGTT